MTEDDGFHGRSPIAFGDVVKLDENWLEIELLSSRLEIQRWPVGLRQSFESLNQPRGLSAVEGSTKPEDVNT